MSAPSSKYSNQILKGVIAGEEKPLLRQALALEEYGNDSSFNKAFHCNLVRHRKDAEGKEVVIGMCSKSGGAGKIAMHAEKRWSKLRYMIGAEEYVLFNDGGLNTKASAGVNEMLYRYSNYLKIDGNVVSAYYDKTDKIEISAFNKSKNQSLFTWVEVQTNVPAKTTIESTIWLIRANGQAAKGDEITLYVRATNSEGEMTDTHDFICAGIVGEIHNWKLLTAQNQNPDTGTTYSVMLTPTQESYISTLLQSNASGWNKEIEHEGLIEGLHGKIGEDMDMEDVLSSFLPKGHYYGVEDDRGERVILMVSSDSEPYAWCNSTYVAPQPQTNPLDSFEVSVQSLFIIGRDGSSVTLSSLTVEITNGGDKNLNIGVDVKMVDGASDVAVGNKTDSIGAGETIEMAVLDTEKDEPISYSSVEGTPTARVTITTTVENISYSKEWEIEL